MPFKSKLKLIIGIILLLAIHILIPKKHKGKRFRRLDGKIRDWI